MLVTLQLLQVGPCHGQDLHYAIESGPLTPYTTPFHVDPGQQFSIAWIQDPDHPNCCFKEWTSSEGRVSYDEEYTTVGAAGTDPEPEITYIANTEYCEEPCTPRYKDYVTLLQKANCICTNLNVAIVPICPPMGAQAFVIYDVCIPDDPANNIRGIPYHIIMLVLDPNYLLQIIECICGGRSDPEYLPESAPN